jgi:hypothetical protein
MNSYPITLLFNRAWWLARIADVKTFSPDPFLTITGIGLMYSQLCLENGHKGDAVIAIIDSIDLMLEHLTQRKSLTELEGSA